jgi:hypothetical protein
VDKKRPGRPRKNTSSNQAAQSDLEEEADPTSGPFFLKHQNVAQEDLFMGEGEEMEKEGGVYG